MVRSRTVTAACAAVFLGFSLACGPAGTTASTTVVAGQTVALARENQKDPEVWVCVDDKAQTDLTRFSTRRDVGGVQQMMLDGRFFVVTRGTKATVTRPGVMTVGVRIEDGKHAGRDGVVIIEDVKR